ncbi:MAG: tetraacyldisaccharide 4'-kinase, partial [Caulobacteraceae bacterium]|nr:tetraacyldisaccharide 4'-kinase [Caulobacter sp.]
RLAGARAASAAGAEAVVMDDGHQNPAVAKALSLVVVDGDTREGRWPFGDGAVVPAGPMREPLEAGLARAHAVIVLMPAGAGAPDPELLALFGALPVLAATLEAAAPPPRGPQLGFAGVAKPWKVAEALARAGCDLLDFAPFPDHAPFREDDLRRLARHAAALGAGLVTTEKDHVRLPPAWRERVVAWPVAARFADPAALDALLAQALGRPLAAAAAGD